MSKELIVLPDPLQIKRKEVINLIDRVSWIRKEIARKTEEYKKEVGYSPSFHKELL